MKHLISRMLEGCHNRHSNECLLAVLCFAHENRTHRRSSAHPIPGQGCMKNEYTFAALAKQEVAPGPDADALFFSMLAPVLRGGPLVAYDSMTDLRMQLTAPAYYVAHKLVAHAGKRVIFQGRVAQASVTELLVFLDAAVASGDLRPLLLAPVFEGTPAQVIHIDGDVLHVYAAIPGIKRQV
ncbi:MULTISPECIES: hypothetical protein [Janthinobacterium]|nr:MULTISPECIES: hypothetical protein [Janthinobacterium]MBW3502495.1 hypothetical protein [Janthinobacterium sp. NKUCC08_JDC]